MGYVQHTKRPVRAGRLQWTAITSGQAQRLEKQHATSACRQAPAFLTGLPTISADHEPREEITQKLRSLIRDQDYTEAFQQAIKTVGQQGIPELDRIHTLNQFYFLVDAFATWIPELRVWEWKENIYHERTDYPRITQFYYYFNQPEILAPQNPVCPDSDAFLTPLSLWMREFAADHGKFLDTNQSTQCLDSYRSPGPSPPY